MDHQHRSFADSHPAVSTFYVFSGLVGLTQPITDLVSGAIAALRAMRSTAREKSKPAPHPRFPESSRSTNAR